jgi:hypothetical protein
MPSYQRVRWHAKLSESDKTVAVEELKECAAPHTGVGLICLQREMHKAGDA